MNALILICCRKLDLEYPAHSDVSRRYNVATGENFSLEQSLSSSSAAAL